MRQKYILILVSLVLFFMPVLSFAGSKEMTIVGTVTGKQTSRVSVKTSSGKVYSPDIGYAKLLRRNGTSMKLEEVTTGDKVEFKGTLWSDNSFSAVYLKNLSLYAKNSTFNGKIISVSPSESRFTLQTAQYGMHIITTDQFTSFKKNNKNASLGELEPGMTAQVKGIWERSRENIQAKSIDAKLRLVNIEFSGRMVLKSPTGITVASGDTLYGVDIASAKFQNKSGKSLSFDRFAVGEEVRVKGKHGSGDTRVVGESVRKIKD